MTLDPLTDTADPGHYVARAETERLLAQLEKALDDGVRTVLLSGPAGVGKTLLLHVLEERELDRHRVLFSPFLHFPPDEADAWLLGLWHERTGQAGRPGSWPEALRGAASEMPVLLIVDDAQSIPVATAARLAATLDVLGDRVSLVLAGVEGESLDEVAEALGESVLRLRLELPLTLEEAGDLLEQADLAGAHGLTEPLGLSKSDARALHAASEGNPGALRALLFRMALGEQPASFAPETEAPASGALEVEASTASAGVEADEGLDILQPGGGEARGVHEEDGSVRTPSWRVELLAVAVSFILGIIATQLFLDTAALPGLEAFSSAPLASRPPVAAPPIASPSASASASASASPTAPATVSRPPSPPLEEVVPLAAPTVSAAPPVTLYVNAQPWARIRMDGEELGVTPLHRPNTSPGRYRFEVTFPDGRVLTRDTEVGPDSRFVSFR